MVASQTFGVPKSVTASNGRTLKRARYTTSEQKWDYRKHSNEHPFFGTRQGSGNSPAIWCFLSSILYDCYDKEAAKATYTTPSGSEDVLALGMVGFVDDSNGQTNLFDRDDTELTRQQIIVQLEHNAQLWAELLGATGGALELSKFSYASRHGVAIYDDRSTDVSDRFVQI